MTINGSTEVCSDAQNPYQHEEVVADDEDVELPRVDGQEHAEHKHPA